MQVCRHNLHIFPVNFLEAEKPLAPTYLLFGCMEFLMIQWNRLVFSIRYCYIKRAKNKRIITVLQQILLCKYDQEKNHLNLTSSLLFLSFKSIKRHFASCFFFHFKKLGSVRSAVNIQNQPTPLILFYWVQLHMFQIKDVHDFFKIKSNVGSENVTKIYSCAVHFFLWALKFVVFINKFDNLLTQFNLFCCKEIWWKEVKLISSLMDLATKRNCVQSI